MRKVYYSVELLKFSGTTFNNRNLTLSHLHSLEKRFKRDPSMGAKYKQAINRKHTRTKRKDTIKDIVKDISGSLHKKNLKL